LVSGFEVLGTNGETREVKLQPKGCNSLGISPLVPQTSRDNSPQQLLSPT